MSWKWNVDSVGFFFFAEDTTNYKNSGEQHNCSVILVLVFVTNKNRIMFMGSQQHVFYKAHLLESGVKREDVTKPRKRSKKEITERLKGVIMPSRRGGGGGGKGAK